MNEDSVDETERQAPFVVLNNEPVRLSAFVKLMKLEGQDKHGMSTLDDVDVERTELRKRLARRQQQKAELERQVYAARRQFQEEIAPLKEEVLRLQMERLRRSAQKHMYSARHRNPYHDAQRAYESFRDNRSRPETASVDNPKVLYRRASKRCHPDVVPDGFREQAAATFRALEAAYEAGHDRAVQAIAEALDRWGFPRASGTPEKQGRTHDVAHLRHAVADLEDAIQAIQGTDAYQDLQEAGDLDALLRAQREQLRQSLHELKRQ